MIDWLVFMFWEVVSILIPLGILTFIGILIVTVYKVRKGEL